MFPSHGNNGVDFPFARLEHLRNCGMLSAETEAAGCIDTDACVNATRWCQQRCRDTTGNAVFACTEFPRKLGSNTDQLTISHMMCSA